MNCLDLLPDDVMKEKKTERSIENKNKLLIEEETYLRILFYYTKSIWETNIKENWTSFWSWFFYILIDCIYNLKNAKYEYKYGIINSYLDEEEENDGKNWFYFLILI